MSTVEIDRVVYSELMAKELVGARLEAPGADSSLRAPVLQLAGWVLGRSSRAVAVRVDSAGRMLRLLPVENQRPDVAKMHPEHPGAGSSGFAGIVSLLGLPSVVQLNVVAVLENGRRVPLASIHGHRSPLRTSYDPSFQPLMLTTLGRTGSTWMMNLLAAHPKILVHGGYPYESKTAKFWLQVLMLLSEPAMQQSPPEPFHANRWWVGPNPYFQWDVIREPTLGEGLYVDRMAELCQRNIDSWYMSVATGQSKQDAVYVGEKFPPTVLPALVRELYPRAREIFLIRDLRDMVCSIRAFDEKRGFHGFGRQEGESLEVYIRKLGNSARSLHKSWRLRSEDAYLVRYEDLALRPEKTLPPLLEYLALDSSPVSVAELIRRAQCESEKYASHRTSRSSRDSVGRWRRELDHPLRKLLEEVFGEVLEGFGYFDSPVMAAEANTIEVPRE